MKIFTRKAVFPLFAILFAMGLPVIFALYLAYVQALNSEKNIALSYAADVQYRADTLSDQMDQGFRILETSQASDPCSETNIINMRRIDVSSSYLQTVGHVVGNQIVCSAYGVHDPVQLGPADVVHSNGVRMWTNVVVPFAVGNTFMVLERRGYAAVLHKDHATDVTTNVTNVSLVWFSRETGTILSSRGNIRPEWLEILDDQDQITTVRDGYIIASVRSDRYLTKSIAAIPVLHLREMMYEYTRALLPIGVISGLILVFMVMRLLHQRSILQEATFNLDERVKELTLMHKTARMLMDKRRDIRNTFIEITKLIPPAMQFPEVCEVRIVHNNIETATPGWRESPYMLASNFVTDDGQRGSIEVVYTRRLPGVDMESFLSEEHTLVDSISEMLTAYLNRRLADDRVNQLAYFERVTGLPNRVTLEDRLNEAIKAAETDGMPVALLLLNLSGFRDIVSTLGYQNSDELLRHVADALSNSLGENDLLASMGGDEFVVLLTQACNPAEIEKVIAKIMKTLGRPAQIGGIPIKLEIAIGVAIFPDHGDSAELLMQRSEIALVAARSSHRNHLLYSPGIDNYQPDRIALVGELPEAIEHDQLLLHYQPKVDLNSGRIVGVESLIRWQHPERGLVFPDQFIPLAERTQIINSLTRWVLKETLRQGQVWRDAGYDLGLSINLSTRNLLDTELCESIPDLAHASGVPLDLLTLEITESAIMADPEQCKRLLDGLHARGVVFSMDDFGIGQSSLGYIKDLPIHKLKIDKSFVIGFHEPRNAAIVHAAIDLGHSLDMQVTAEGIEDEQTLKALKTFGCDIGQGYYFSKPLPVEKLTSWLQESKWGY